MSLKNIKKELDEIEFCLSESFEERVKETLKEAELRSYDPFESLSKEELQIQYITELAVDYEEEQKRLVKRAIELQKILDEAQSLQHALNNIEKLEIVETTRSVVNKQLRKNFIMIEKHYKVTPVNEYGVLDWLADADPENFLGFQ